MAQLVKNPLAMQDTWVQSLGWEDLLEKEMATHSSILAWKSNGWGSLVGYSPWGGKESDMTERLHFHFHFGHLGELRKIITQFSVFWSSDGVPS